MKIYAICYQPNLILQGRITLTWDSLTKHNSKMSSSFNDLQREEPINDVIHLWLYVTYPQLKKTTVVYALYSQMLFLSHSVDSLTTRRCMSESCYHNIYLHQLYLGNILDRYSFLCPLFCHETHFLGEVIKTKRTDWTLFRTSQLTNIKIAL